MKKTVNKALSALIAAQLLGGTFCGTAMAANNFIISGDNQTETTIAGNKAYGQDYFVKKDENGNYVQDTEWKHGGAIIMTKDLSDGGGDQFQGIFKKINAGRILPTYINISEGKDHWVPTFISIAGSGTGTGSFTPGADGYEQVAQELRDALDASAPGGTLEEKVAAFVKNGNIPERWKALNKMIMIQIEQGDPSEERYSRLREGPTKIEPNYGTVQIGRLGVWRPMDWGDTVYYKDESCTSDSSKLATLANLRIMPNGMVQWTGNNFFPQTAQGDRVQTVTDALLYVDKLEMQSGAKVDLSYLNIVGDNPRVNQYSYDKVYYAKNQLGESADSLLARTMVINDAVLDHDTTFRLGAYKILLRQDKTNEFVDKGGRRSDTVWIKNAAQKNVSDTPGKINIELGYVPELGEGVSGAFTMAKDGTSGSYNTVFGIMNGAENFEVVGKASRAEGIFSEYLVEPEIQEFRTNDQGYFDNGDGSHSGRAWQLTGYSYQIVGASEGGKTAGDNIVVANNLWKNSQRNVFRRAGGLHNVGELPEHKDNVWAEAWHGNYQSATNYGRQVSQSFNGYQVGYDNLIARDFYNGKVYFGAFVNKNDGNSTTQTGQGKQDATGIGLYSTWVGERGHYIDVAVMRSKLKNDYNLTQTFATGAERVTGEFDTWAYGLGAQYGYRKHMKDGWFIEPQLAVYAGKVNDCKYDLVSESGKKQTLKQASFSNITAKAGLFIGKDLNAKGNIYLGAFVGHDYAKDMRIQTSYQTVTTGTTGLPVTLNLSDSVDMPDSEDNWYELNIGGKYNISPTGSAYVNYSKTLGSSVGNSWRINGGVQWGF